MRTIIKNLKRYKWVYSDKQVVVKDKTTEQSVVLDKVGFLSLSRFILRSLDAMRIDNIGYFKVKLSSVKEKYKKEKSIKKEKAKSSIPKKESGHSLVSSSQVESGGQV